MTRVRLLTGPLCPGEPQCSPTRSARVPLVGPARLIQRHHYYRMPDPPLCERAVRRRARGLTYAHPPPPCDLSWS